MLLFLRGSLLARWHTLTAIALIAVVLAVLALAPAASTEEPPVYALTNARVVSVSRAPLEKGTVVIRKGIIEAVGTDISVPGDARIIDAAGLIVYPGLIDSLSDVALEEERTPSATAARPAGSPQVPFRQQQLQSAPAAPPSEKPGLTPHMQTADILNLANRKIEAARSAGITTALVAPRRGFFQGQSALVNLSGTSVGQMVVKTPVAMHIGLQSSGGFGGDYPGSLMGIFAFVKQTLLDAQHHGLAWDIYNANPGTRRPEYDRALQALQPVLKRALPVVLPGDTPAEISRSLDLAASFDLNIILSGGAEAGKIGAVLQEKKIPVLLSAKFPERDRDADPELEEELEALRRRVEAPANAAVLAKAGVKFAFQSGDMATPRDFIRNVARTVEAGLPKDVALRALTLSPAEIFGVADRVGSIDKGKTANLIVTTGDIFDARTRVKYVFVDGQRFEITEPEPVRSTEPPTTGARNFSGTWVLKANTSQGPVESTLHLTQSRSALTGTIITPVGTTDITEGFVTGNNIRFKISISPPEGGPMVVVFTGTIQGDNISGTADRGARGKVDFTGTRNPNKLQESRREASL